MTSERAVQDQSRQASNRLKTVVDASVPRIFGSPKRYIQGDGLVDRAGDFLKSMGITHAAVLLSPRSRQAEGGRLLTSLDSAGITSEVALFHGECSFEEIAFHVDALNGNVSPVNALVAIGGGKVVDAGKSMAFRLGVPVIIVPSLASNDAPCSAISVIYTEEGAATSFESFPENPALVLVDTGVIAMAGVRHLVAGIGDAMATWYEARVCSENDRAMTTLGGRPTLAGTAIAKLCAETIFEHAQAAILAVQHSVVDESLEKVVEANILLSGVGFESGGLAVAHAVAQAYTVVGHVHKNFLHGEMVAMGVLAQLSLESRLDEAEKVARFFTLVGLPIQLGQLGLSSRDTEELQAIAAAAVGSTITGNMPFKVTPSMLFDALVSADQLGQRVTEDEGDTAFVRLHT